MLDSIWTLLNGYGLDTNEIAEAIHSLFQVSTSTDAEGNVVESYTGSLAALADFPIIGTVLKAFASFAPATSTTEIIG